MSEPTDEPVPRRRRWTARQLVDLTSVLLVLVSMAGIVALAFTVGDRAGWLVLCLAGLATGLILGMDRGVR